MRILFTLFITTIIVACTPKKTSNSNLFLNSEYVNIQGAESIIQIINSSTDTLKLNSRHFYYLPYYEEEHELIIAPNDTGNLQCQFTFPSFVTLYPIGLRILSAPYLTPTVVVHKNEKVTFKGDFNDINTYYYNFDKHYNGIGNQESKSYYFAGDTIDNMNNFPALADSITEVSISYLSSYEKPLPKWFYKHEEWRLKYNGAFRKDNVLLSKAFQNYGRSVNKITLVASNYFTYENQMPIYNDEMIINTAYLYYVQNYFNNMTFKLNEKRINNNQERIHQLQLIDSLYGQTEFSDVLKMAQFSYINKQKAIYDSVIVNANFYNEENANAIDRINREKNSLPLMGQKAIPFKLPNYHGDTISLDDLLGKPSLINFWASWCKACIYKFEEENEIFNKYGTQLNVVNICVETEEDSWRNLSESKNLNMINLFANKRMSRILKRNYGLQGMPRSILLDEKLNVVDNYFNASVASVEEYLLKK